MSDGYIMTSSGLVKKRAELAGDIETTEKKAREMRAALANLDHTILLFDPTQKPARIKARKRRPAGLFGNGGMTRVVLDVLREAGGEPMSTDEIAAAVIRRQRMEDTARTRALVFGGGVRDAAAERAGRGGGAGVAGGAAAAVGVSFP